MTTTEKLEKIRVKKQANLLESPIFLGATQTVKDLFLPQKSAYSFPTRDIIEREMYEQLKLNARVSISFP